MHLHIFNDFWPSNLNCGLRNLSIDSVQFIIGLIWLCLWVIMKINFFGRGPSSWGLFLKKEKVFWKKFKFCQIKFGMLLTSRIFPSLKFSEIKFSNLPKNHLSRLIKCHKNETQTKISCIMYQKCRTCEIE